MPYFPTEADAEDHARDVANTIIKVEMKKRQMTYRDLVAALAEYGVKEEERNLRNKISRGTFSAAFFFICLGAMKVKNLDLTYWLTSPEDKLSEIRAIIDGGEVAPQTPEERQQKYEGLQALAQVLIEESDEA